VSAELVRLEVKAMRNARGVRQRQAKPIRFKGEISDLDSPAQGLSLVALLTMNSRQSLGKCPPRAAPKRCRLKEIYR
jgi:hypothetical protein